MYQTGNIFCDVIANFFASIIVPVSFSLIVIAFVWALCVFGFVGDYDEEARAKAKALIIWSILMFIILVFVWGLLTWLFGSSFFSQSCSAVSL